MTVSRVAGATLWALASVAEPAVSGTETQARLCTGKDHAPWDDAKRSLGVAIVADPDEARKDERSCGVATVTDPVKARGHPLWIGDRQATDGLHFWKPLDPYKTTICGELAVLRHVSRRVQ